MKFTEHDKLSAEIAQWCRAYLPDDAFASCVAHGARHYGMAIKLKQLGVESGIGDWMVLWRGSFATVELKTGTGKLSQEQKDTGERIMRSGGRCYIAHNLGEFITCCRLMFIPILETPRRDSLDDPRPLW